jgi:hypothetical protein
VCRVTQAALGPVERLRAAACPVERTGDAQLAQAAVAKISGIERDEGVDVTVGPEHGLHDVPLLPAVRMLRVRRLRA